LQRLRQAGLAQEAVLLSTCNRMELYAVTPNAEGATLRALRQFLLDSRPCAEPLDNVFYFLSEPQSLEHLFRVACGLDSMVLGETEILGQLKQAYELALDQKHTGSRLNKAFQKAFNVAKQIRTETGIQRGSVSVANVAVELAEKIFSSLKHRAVLVIGAGDTSEKTARALLSRGAGSVLVSNRTFERAQALAAELGGRAVPFSEWPQAFASIDIVISSTAAPDYILDRAKLMPMMKGRKNRPILLIDIAVPRDIEPEVNLLENVFLYNIDDLQTIADQYLKDRQAEIARCETIIRDKVRGLLAGWVLHTASGPGQHPCAPSVSP
jgi:glutamyl-tRNA reductase